MLASGGEQPVNTLATQVGTPGRIHSATNRTTSNVSADILAAGESGRELSPAADSPTDSSAYTTSGKFHLQQPGFSSILLAMSTIVPPAETGVGSPLKSVSVLAHYLCQQSTPAPTNVANVWLAEGAGLFHAISGFQAAMDPSTFLFGVLFLVFTFMFLEFVFFSLFPDYFCFD